jgi:hypothetical protein
MLPLPHGDREFLTEEFEKGFSHPATRAADSLLVFGNDSHDGFPAVLDRLIRLVTSDTPAWVAQVLGRDPYAELSNQILGAICALANTPLRDRSTRKDASKNLVLAVEPLLAKYLAIVDEDQHRLRLDKPKKPGLDTLVVRLRSLDLLPQFEILSRDEFESPSGWETRDSFANALRDLIPGRLQAAHESSRVEDHVWKSAMAVMLTLAHHMPPGIAEQLSPPSLPVRARSAISLPPSRFAPDGPPEGQRILATCPEPLTTRRDITTHVVASVESRVKSAGLCLCLVEATWGWGKSVFIKRVLTELRRPTLHIDMASVSTLGQFAEASLRQVPLTAAERRYIDIDPAHAIELLSDALPPNAIIFLESARCSDVSLSEDELTIVIRALMSHGLSVFVECWAPLVLAAIGVTQDHIIRIKSHDLPAINDDEVRRWALVVCDRPLIDEETGSLRILGGNPLQLRLALERIRSLFPTPQPAALDDELLTFTSYIDQQRAYREFLLQGKVDVAAPEALGSRLCAAIACFPTHDLHPNRGLDDRLRQLARIGLVTSRNGRWHTSSWLRLIALREFAAKTGPIEDDIRAALDSVDLSADADVTATRRHLLALQSRRPDVLQALAELSAALPSCTEQNQAFARYRAPLDLANVSSVPIPRPLEWLSIALWDACRTNNIQACQTLAAEINDAPTAAMSSFLQSASGGYTALFSAVPLLPDELALSLHRKLAAVITSPIALVESSLPVVRYLLDASDCALRMGNDVFGKQWRIAARQHLQLIDPKLEDQAFELKYEANVLKIHLADSENERLALHKQTLDVIPSSMARDEDSASLWAIRALEHALPLLVASPASPELLTRTRSEFATAGASDAWFAIWRRYRDAAETLPGPILAIVNEAVGGMARYLENRKQANQYRRLSKVLRSRSLPVDQAIAIIIQYKAEQTTNIASGDAILLDEAFRSLARSQTTPRGSVAQLVAVAESMLAKVSHRLSTNTLEIRRLRRSVFLYLLEHQLITVRSTETGLWNHGTNKGRHERLLSRLIWLTNRCGTPWAWSDGINALFRLQAIRLRHTQVSKRLQVLNLCNAGRERYIDEAVKTLNDHPATQLLRLRQSRYVWDWPAAVSAARKLFLAQAPEPYAKDAETAVYDLVSTVVLIHPELRHWSPQVDDYDDCRQMLVQILESRISLEARTARKEALKFQLQLATNRSTPEAWRGLVEILEGRIGPPKDYWNDVILKRLKEDDPVTQADDEEPAVDLTDMDWLLELGTIVRYGMADTSLDVALRHRLGEYAVAITMDIMSWHRSLEISNFLWRWHLGTSIVFALFAAEGTSPALFEDLHSPLSTRKGHRLTWVALAQRELEAVCNGPDTQFTHFARGKTKQFLQQLNESGWLKTR